MSNSWEILQKHVKLLYPNCPLSLDVKQNVDGKNCLEYSCRIGLFGDYISTNSWFSTEQEARESVSVLALNMIKIFTSLIFKTENGPFHSFTFSEVSSYPEFKTCDASMKSKLNDNLPIDPVVYSLISKTDPDGNNGNQRSGSQKRLERVVDLIAEQQQRKNPKPLKLEVQASSSIEKSSVESVDAFVLFKFFVSNQVNEKSPIDCIFLIHQKAVEIFSDAVDYPLFSYEEVHSNGSVKGLIATLDFLGKLFKASCESDLQIPIHVRKQAGKERVSEHAINWLKNNVDEFMSAHKQRLEVLEKHRQMKFKEKFSTSVIKNGQYNKSFEPQNRPPYHSHESQNGASNTSFEVSQVPHSPYLQNNHFVQSSQVLQQPYHNFVLKNLSDPYSANFSCESPQIYNSHMQNHFMYPNHVFYQQQNNNNNNNVIMRQQTYPSYQPYQILNQPNVPLGYIPYQIPSSLPVFSEKVSLPTEIPLTSSVSFQNVQKSPLEHLNDVCSRRNLRKPLFTFPLLSSIGSRQQICHVLKWMPTGKSYTSLIETSDKKIAQYDVCKQILDDLIENEQRTAKGLAELINAESLLRKGRFSGISHEYLSKKKISPANFGKESIPPQNDVFDNQRLFSEKQLQVRPLNDRNSAFYSVLPPS